MTKSILHFNGVWRSYQKRILDDLDFHLRDSKLHIVAAPGAGKTTLGIEVISRLNRASLILCPTNTIKDQWKERIQTSFLQKKDFGIVSTDIHNPSFLTIVTYQALLAAFCGHNDDESEDCQPDKEDGKEYAITNSSRFQMEKAEEIIGILQSANVSLLCFDEAHHLRKEWWKALSYLVEHLKPAQTVSLTATPPYDADINEWNRYQALCGDIDEVISIPELVKNGDLCPHQDFIHFSKLHPHELELLKNHKRNVNVLMEKLREDARLHELLSQMHFLQDTDNEIEAILEKPDFFVSIASLLNENGYTIPRHFLDLFGATARDIPMFDIKQATAFLNGFIFVKKEEWKDMQAIRSEYHSLTKQMGLTDGKKVVLDGNDKFYRQIANSIGKLDSIVSIVDLESNLLKENLRMVILTDYIRKNCPDCSMLGVVPIWRKLKTEFQENISLAVLCGSLILLPASIVGKFQHLLSDNGISNDAVSLENFEGDENYIQITPKKSIRNHIVSLVTELFNNGDLTVLVGTQALLGEGWDAPSINSLILSSTVSSYMLSNQMRGRAIRIDVNHPDKVSNIWHLATYDPSFETMNYDLSQIISRFEGFEAPSYFGKHQITSGIERVWIPIKSGILQTNLSLAKNRELTRQWWNDALYIGYSNKPPIGLSSGVQTNSLTIKSLCYTGYLYYIWILIFVLLSLLRLPQHIRSFGLVVVGLVVVALLMGLVVFKYIRTGTVEGVLKQISIVILETLSTQGLIKTSLKQVGLRVTNEQGTMFVSCANLPAEENNLFIQCLQEFLDPVENPRYLLVRHERFRNLVNQTDYFAIPSVISPNKKSVEIFKKLWRTYIGKCDIVYTRSAEGRKILLKARKYAFSAIKRDVSKRVSKWL